MKHRLLGGTALARIDENGEYQSPNICYIDDNEPEHDSHGDDEIDAGEEDEAESDEGAEGEDEGEDEDEEDHGEETEGREEGRTRDEGVLDKPKRKTTSDVVRENKRWRKESERKADEALRRAEAAERRAEAAERAATARQQTESAEQRAARFAAMSPEERFDALRAEDKAAHQAEMNGVKFQIWDSSDRAEFRTLCREDPLVAKVKDKVEARYAELQRAGSPVSREILADIEVGKMMRAGQKTAGTKQRKRAEADVRRETVRPRRVGSDASANRSRRGNEDSPEARRRRLENVIL